jgi:hypothetical protein
MHEKYGPIIRINPHELHVLDPDFYEVLYAAGGSKRDRDPWHTNSLALENSLLATVPHDLHRKRRAALSPFFSMASTRRLQPVVEERVGMLIKRLVELKDSGKVVNLLHALSAFSNGNSISTLRARQANKSQMLLQNTALGDHIIELKMKSLIPRITNS